jgi:glycine/D-amino acid oxidase-like deaminating enzyme
VIDFEGMATDGKNLRTGRSIWIGRKGPRVLSSPLLRNHDTDVLVIGAGITGAMLADKLAAEGARVMVVDRRGAAKGSTAASTALAQHEIDTPLIHLTTMIGKERAVRAWRRSRLAVEALAARFGELRVPDVQRRDSLYLTGNVLDADELLREKDARLASGLSARFLGRKALFEEFGIRREAALLGYGNLVLDPRKATLALLRSAHANGARLCAPVEVVAIEPGRGSTTAVTARKNTITCRDLVYATGYEVPDVVPRDRHKITATWAIATVPQSRGRLWPNECCIWEAANPYLYVRTSSEGRVICGGEDEDIDDEERRDARLPRKAETLRRKLHRLLPRLDTTIDYTWTGTFGETTTGLPLIGRIPGKPHCWAALGYGGNGTTYAAIAADVIAGAILGRRDNDADLYRFP